jgi:hypothetical protein
MTLRATNNRFGLYPHRNIDIYYDAIPIAEEIMRAAASRSMEALLEIIRNVRTCSSEGSDLQELLGVLEDRIDTLFEDVVRTVGATMRNFFSDTVFHPRDASNPFWIDVQARFGRGPGYREDVLNMYADQLQEHEDFLADAAEDCWRRILIDPILDYLG